MAYTNNKKVVYIIICSLFVSLAFTQSLQDMQKMKAEYDRLKKSETLLGPETRNDIQINDNIGIPQNAFLIPYDQQIDSVDSKLLHYGYNFFTKRDTVSFWENLPIPPDYILGPGDELVISLWGETQLRKNYIISREGEIFDDKVGILYPSGKTINECKEYLTKQFGRIYSTLNGRNGTTYMGLSLGKLRSINVNFVGEMKFPGVYAIHPFSSVITGLIQAGGVDTTGSLRAIHIKRNNKIHTTVDLYQYLLFGNLPSNIQLRDQDIVVVPVRLSSVVVDSAVTRPGIYESLADENIKTVIDYAGGIRPNASSSISIKRILSMGERISGTLDIENFYIDYGKSQNYKINNGDIITVRTIFSSISQVEIIGQVKNPGIYNYYVGMTIKDLLELGSGFSDTTYIKSIYQDRAELVRRNPNNPYEEVIEINLKKLINGNASENLLLQNLDRFVVHANPNFFEKKNITLNGEVNVPGSYPLIKDNETLSSLIQRSGGLTSKALKDGIAIYRDKKYFEIIEDSDEDELANSINRDGFVVPKYNKANKLPEKVRVAWNNEGLSLMPGDSVVVKQATRTINISGAVYNPGLVEFRPGKSLNYYLNSSGGIKDSGSRKNIIVIYANGIVAPKKWYSSPKIYDGATIYVNKKENQEPFNLTQFATNWTQIISSVITAVILSKQISS